MKKNKAIGMYLHIPFCKQKCFYCDFVSYSGKEVLHREYVEALKQEITEVANQITNSIDTIYIGGGTPSYLRGEDIQQLIDTIQKKYQVEEKAERTIEVNPGTVTEEKLQIYRNSGINRISIGLQTNDNMLLKEIGRIHRKEDFLETYQLARKVGFTNCNVDMMIGLPKQTMQEVKETLQQLLSLQPEHISVYSLILEEGTKLYQLVEQGKLTLPEETLERQMYWYVKEQLQLAGYCHYEISNFAKLGYESKHNVHCWKQKEYIGMGVAAHSYYKNRRYSNTEDLRFYLSCIETKKREQMTMVQEIQDKKAKQKEYMLLGLRMIQGVSINEFMEQFGVNPMEEYAKEIEGLIHKQLLRRKQDSIQLTEKGLDFANIVWEEFI